MKKSQFFNVQKRITKSFIKSLCNDFANEISQKVIQRRKIGKYVYVLLSSLFPRTLNIRTPASTLLTRNVNQTGLEVPRDRDAA